VRLLLDTQASFLLTHDTRAIPARALDAVTDAGNARYLSIVSPWELQIKVGTGKMKLSRTVEQAVQFELDRGAITLLPITLPHIDELSRLPNYHRDPFDRLLIAQAIHDGLTLVTGDRTIPLYPVPCLWD
jgi:PIN domain nuclease of toxin-antitoxin system